MKIRPRRLRPDDMQVSQNDHRQLGIDTKANKVGPHTVATAPSCRWSAESMGAVMIYTYDSICCGGLPATPGIIEQVGIHSSNDR